MSINKALWAKKKQDQRRNSWLPLYQHLEDTKNIAGLLWDNWLSQGQRDLIDQATNFRGRDLALFLAAIHDLGKATPVFQCSKSFSYQGGDIDEFLIGRIESSGFYNLSLFKADGRGSKHALAGQYILYKSGFPDQISTIVGSHHGLPVDDIKEVKNQISYKKNYYQSDLAADEDLCKKWADQQEAIIAWALDQGNFSGPKDFENISQPAQVILAGLIIMADWIASNENYFPLIDIEDFYVEDPASRHIKAFEKWKKTAIWEAEDLGQAEMIYKSRFGFASPNNFQKSFYELIESQDDSQIFIVEAAMGKGKTEAALIGAEQLAYKLGSSGLYFGLPTQATSNGIFPRINDWLNNMLDFYKEEWGYYDDEDKFGIRLNHGKAALNEVFSSLAHHINQDDKDTKDNVIVNEWFAGKKTSALDDFVVGTVDQILMMALKQKHLALRHLGFSKKVVVIDEVHAYDAYMSQYLDEALVWLGALKVPVIILSATLPPKRRLELIKAYLKGKGIILNKDQRMEAAKKLSTTEYPLISYNDGNQIKTFTDFEDEETKEIDLIKYQGQIEDLIDELYKEEGNIGIIVNTVKKAQDLAMTFKEKYGGDQVFLLHSNFIATDRAEKEKDLLDLVGKNADRPRKKIIIGTQVIEQSLDIDFDVMVSQLAPMDLLIQRMGRLHRHKIKRPEAFKRPKFYVVDTSEDFDFESGSAAVYGSYLLARTQYYLEEKIQLPKDIPILVGRVYDFDENENMDADIYLRADLVETYLDFKKSHISEKKKKETKAKTFKIADPVLKKTTSKKDNLIGWLAKAPLDTGEEAGLARVRDIKDTVEVIALKKIGPGYGTFKDQVDISKEISKTETAKDLAKNTLRLPSIFNHISIDKLIRELEENNIRDLSDWQESSWLKGSLGLIFDENNECSLQGIKLEYSREFGVRRKE